MAVRTTDVSRWSSELLWLRRYLAPYVKRYYGEKVFTYVIKRFEGAYEVILRSRLRVSSTIPKGSGVAMVLVSSRALEEGPERVIRVRTLSGDVVEVVLGTPLEESYHVVQVGPYGLKCTCRDALMLASRADSEFIAAAKLYGIKRFELQTPLFTKYVLCKHTLAAAAYALASNVLSRDLKVFREVLKLSALGAALRVLGGSGVRRSAVIRSYNVMLRLSRGLPP